MQGGEARRKEPSIIPKAHGQGSPCLTLDCTAEDPKGNWKEERESSNTKATLCVQPRGWREEAKRMEGRSQEDGGRKPGG